MPILSSIGNVGSNTASTATIQTSSQIIGAGSGVYILIAFLGGTVSDTISSISDSQAGVYSLIDSLDTSSQASYFVYRRNSPVAASAAFTATITQSTPTVSMAVIAMEVLNDGGVYQFGTGSGTGAATATCSVPTEVGPDLILFFGICSSVCFFF